MLRGRYRLDLLIATGGMGEVWRGTDLAIDRRVAIKVVRPEHADDEDGLARFRAEAHYAGSLSHPNIAQVFDYGDAVAPEPGYLVMELVDGLLGLLVAGRMRPAAAAYASDLLIEHVITDVYEGALFAQRIEADPGYFDSLSQYLHALPADRFPNIAAMVDHLTAGGSGSGDARFEFGLDVIFHSLANATVATDDESTRAAVVRPVRGIHVPSTA